jgi:hypothetical protein
MVCFRHAKNRFAMRAFVDDRFGSVIVAARAGHRVNPRDLNPSGLGQFRLRTTAYEIIIGNKDRKNAAFFGKIRFFHRTFEQLHGENPVAAGRTARKFPGRSISMTGSGKESGDATPSPIW